MLILPLLKFYFLFCFVFWERGFSFRIWNNSRNTTFKHLRRHTFDKPIQLSNFNIQYFSCILDNQNILYITLKINALSLKQTIFNLISFGNFGAGPFKNMGYYGFFNVSCLTFFYNFFVCFWFDNIVYYQCGLNNLNSSSILISIYF